MVSRSAARAKPEEEPRAPRFNLVKRETLKERIYKEVRRALQMGRFDPGEAITVKMLEDELGAGAMPIRESLQRLVAEGGLVNLPNGRVRVPLYTADEYEEITEMRLRLEGLAASRAAVRRTQEELEEIIRLHDQLNSLIGANVPWTEITECNRKFHFAVYEASHGRHLVALVDNLWLRVSPMVAVPLKLEVERRTAYVPDYERMHTELMEAIRDQDSRAAEAAIRQILLASAAWYHRHYQFAEEAMPGVSWR